MKYYDYPIINKYDYELTHDPLNTYGPTKGFPKLTICLNSQHSASKINVLFNATKEEILRAMPFLYGSYGDDHGEKFFQFLHRKRNSSLIQFVFYHCKQFA